VPTATQRLGDFSDLLKVPDPAPHQYTIYDPRSARRWAAGSCALHSGDKGIPVLTRCTISWSSSTPCRTMCRAWSPRKRNNLYADYQPRTTPAQRNQPLRLEHNRQAPGERQWYWDDRHSSEYDWAYNTPLRGTCPTRCCVTPRHELRLHLFHQLRQHAEHRFQRDAYNAGSGDP